MEREREEDHDTRQKWLDTLKGYSSHHQQHERQSGMGRSGHGSRQGSDVTDGTR